MSIVTVLSNANSTTSIMSLAVGYIVRRISDLEWLEIINHVTRMTRHTSHALVSPVKQFIAHGSPLSHHFN